MKREEQMAIPTFFFFIPFTFPLRQWYKLLQGGKKGDQQQTQLIIIINCRSTSYKHWRKKKLFRTPSWKNV
jgi:hypothetical protein